MPTGGMPALPACPSSRATANSFSHLSPAGQSAAQGNFVRVLEVSSDGQPAREARHPNAAPEAVGEVRGGCLPRHVRVRREDDLLDPIALDAAHQLVDPKMPGLDSVDRRERTAEHVIQAAVFVRPLERDEVDGLLDDADESTVPSLVTADLAALLLGQVAALGTEPDSLLDVSDRLGECLR